MEYKKANNDAEIKKVNEDMVQEKVDEDIVQEKVDEDIVQEKADEDIVQEKADDEDMECYKVEDIDLNPLPPFENRRTYMDFKDLVKEIVLPFLPAKALVKFKSVSKVWGEWISRPFLAHLQSYLFKNLSGFFCQSAGGDPTFVTLDNAAYGVPTPSLSFLPELVKILSSCNGLLLCHGRDGSYYVCNPATEKFTRLPRPELCHETKSAPILAFEPSELNMEGHYQLIIGIPMLDHVYFELYSSETKSWRVSGTTLVDMDDPSLKRNGFYMKGVAYWEASRGKVIAFHLSTELYEIISLPRAAPVNGILTQIHGELCYVAVSWMSSKEKNDYDIMIFTGINLSLKDRISVKLGPERESVARYRVLPCLDGDTVMILVGSDIYSYSRSDGSTKVITTVESGSVDAMFLAYVNSLVQFA